VDLKGCNCRQTDCDKIGLDLVPVLSPAEDERLTDEVVYLVESSLRGRHLVMGNRWERQDLSKVFTAVLFLHDDVVIAVRVLFFLLSFILVLYFFFIQTKTLS